MAARPFNGIETKDKLSVAEIARRLREYADYIEHESGVVGFAVFVMTSDDVIQRWIRANTDSKDRLAEHITEDAEDMIHEATGATDPSLNPFQH